MINIYNKGIVEENSIQGIPSGYIDGEKNNLLKFLGSFWKEIHSDPSIIKDLQEVNATQLGQFYLNIIENLKLQDRKGAPVFHRELWHPLVLHKSKEGTSSENTLEIGEDIRLGVQDPNSKYGEVELQIGSLASLKDYVTYPVTGDIKSIIKGITNSVINPTTVYTVDSDFPSENIIYKNGTLIFPRDKDPFDPKNGFDIQETPFDPSVSKSGDLEVVLWASDVLIDRNFISDHLAYALNLTCESSAITKRILNTAWDSISSGLTPELLNMLIAALLNIPVIQENKEKVIKITTTETGQLVITDKHKYSLDKNATLRTDINPGTILSKGEFLDQTIKIYPFINNPSNDRLKELTEYTPLFKQDVPVITIPRSLIRANTANGLSVDWTPTDILWDGDYYGNNYRKLYFHLDGAEEDVKIFWEDVWNQAELEDIDLDELFTECEYEGEVENINSDEDSDPAWRIIPAAFFLRHMLGGNTVIITIDSSSQNENISKLEDPRFFSLLNEVFPSTLRLFFIKRQQIGDDTYEFSNADEVLDLYTYENIEDDDDFIYQDLPGMRGKRMPSYEDQVELKFFRNRKRQANQ